MSALFHTGDMKYHTPYTAAHPCDMTLWPLKCCHTGVNLLRPTVNFVNFDILNPPFFKPSIRKCSQGTALNDQSVRVFFGKVLLEWCGINAAIMGAYHEQRPSRIKGPSRPFRIKEPSIVKLSYYRRGNNKLSLVGDKLLSGQRVNCSHVKNE